MSKKNYTTPLNTIEPGDLFEWILYDDEVKQEPDATKFVFVLGNRHQLIDLTYSGNIMHTQRNWQLQNPWNWTKYE